MPASSRPTPEIQKLINEAAKRWKVPNTLIMAIARVETGFDASYVAPSPSTARGMFRATDEMRAPCEPFQAPGASEIEKQILVAASSLAALLDSKLWNGNRPGAIMSWYFAKAGASKSANAIQAGSVRAASLPGGGNTEKWPAAARQYLEAVTSARAQFQTDGKPSGQTRMERLKNALVALQTLNGPEWSARNFGTSDHPFQLDAWVAPIVEAESWEHDLDFGLTTDPDLLESLITKSLEGYAAFFELAPLTNATTPTVKALEASYSAKNDLLEKVIAPFDRGVDHIIKVFGAGLERMDKQMGELAESIETVALYVGLGALGLGVLWVLTRSRS